MNGYNFQNIWDSCLKFNIEQKPEEFKSLLDFLNVNSKKRIALEIGSNYGGFAAGLCELFDKVITIDIKHNTNFDLLKSKYSNYEYIISDSTNNDTINYLKSLNIKFDFIFIDGDHSYDGVKSDYLKFKQLLNSDGYLGFHDVVSSPENEGNNILVSKFWNEIKTQYIDSYEFISDKATNDYSTDNLFHSIMKNQRYESWGGIGIVKNYPVSIFSHNYLKNDWVSIIKNQFERVVKSGLYNRCDHYFCGVYSESDEEYYNFLKMVDSYDKDIKVKVVRYTTNKFEYNTLINLQNYCKLNLNGCVLYYHSKGTSKVIQTDSITSWRDCLEYLNIDNWQKSVDALKTKNYDVVGGLYVTHYVSPKKEYRNYYSGNFWWGDCEYISKLPNLSLTYVDTMYNGDMSDHRMACELWIGKGYHRWLNYYSEYVVGWENHIFDSTKYKVFG